MQLDLDLAFAFTSALVIVASFVLLVAGRVLGRSRS